jgi:hypothetical protein
MTEPPPTIEIFKELSEQGAAGEALQDATFMGWNAVEAALHQQRLKRTALLRLLLAG